MLANIGKEDDEGNTEYKRSLISPSKERLEHLTTQLNFRLNEGSGESIYQIGVEDDGETLGIPEDSLKKSLKTLESMAAVGRRPESYAFRLDRQKAVQLLEVLVLAQAWR